MTMPWSQPAALRWLWASILRFQDSAPGQTAACLDVVTTGKGIESREAFRVFLRRLYGEHNGDLVEMTIERIDTVWREPQVIAPVIPTELRPKQGLPLAPPTAYEHLRAWRR